MKIKQIYGTPTVRCFSAGVQRCIALSCDNESYSTDAGGYDDNSNENLVTDNGTW